MQRVHELVCFVEDHADEINEDGTIPHQFLRDAKRADNCPTEVLNAILGKLPEAILMNFGGAMPLLEFIRRRSQRMVRVVIEFMAQDMKKRNLASLATLTFSFAETWFEENEQNPDTIEAGRDIIRAAFNFNEKPNELLPVDIDLLEILVNLAAPEMLVKINSELSPLEQVLRFDLCLSNSDRQLALAMLILDKCPDSIHDLMTKENPATHPPTIMDQPSVLEGGGKEGQVSRRPLLRNGGLPNRRKPKEIRFTKQDVEAADKASDEICKELGVRFLRSTVFHKDETRNAFREIDTEIQRFFGNHEQRKFQILKAIPCIEEWGVRKIFKVVVYDGDHPHRDEEVEKALAGFVHGKKKYASFDVEVLDWHKEDLCPEVIQTATPQVRELHLHWSGRNSVLRGWSEPEGLPALEYLQKVYIYYTAPSIEESRIRKNIESFTRRMNKPRRCPAKMGQTNQNSTSTQAPVHMQLSRQSTLAQAHEQFDDDCKSLPTIQTVDVGRVTPTGVSGADRAAGSASEFVEQPWFKYVEEFISIIPTPEELPDYDFKNPHLRRAIKAAIEQDVDIISMSWTIRNGNNKIPEATLMELRNVVSACEGTGSQRRRIPIMFCAASDDGIQGRSQHGNREEFPREINNVKVLCIGVADPHGQVWPEVTDQNGLNYLFPGVDIKDVFEDDSRDSDTISEALDSQISDLVTRNERTGSSVATALAAGLAALIIHCTKLGHYYTNAWKGPESRREETITQQFVDQIATYEGMQNALDNLSSGSRSGTKYANPSKDFACAIQDLRQYDVQGGAANNLPQSLKPIATLCRNLCRI
ncbi:hypothetical protein COL5a_008825 [Colletotrichum fioriniae]|nr:hypothetical protein COL5a_008825 [Colletotrichum fioriniae]